jgi:hypothetical protein
MNNEHIQRYYSAVVSKRRLNGPSYDEAAKDLALANAMIFAR